MKIAHLADLHIGYSHLNKRTRDGRNQRLVDFEEAALALAEEAVRQSPDVAVVAGDLFHKINMFPAALSGGVSFVQRFEEAGIPLLVIGGNHDDAESEGNYNGLKFLAEHSKMNLFLDQGYFDQAEARFHLVSYRLLSRAQNGRGELQPFQFARDKANILVTHGYVKNRDIEHDIMADSEIVIPDEWLDDPRFDLKLLGHIHHQYQPRKAAFYSGSVERRNFGESEEDPGFYLHQLLPTGAANEDAVFDQSEVIRNQSSDYEIRTLPVLLRNVHPDLPRPMIDLHFDLAETSVENLNKKVIEVIENSSKGEMIRITLDNAPISLDRNQYRSNWESLARRAQVLSFEATVRSKEMSQLMDIHFSAAPTDIARGLIDYVSQQQIPEDEREEVLQLSKEIITEATEKILASGEEG